MKPIYSVVIPVKDEDKNIKDLVEELQPVMTALQSPWELIYVDDGSSDGSSAILQKLEQEKPYLRLVSFDQNYGQSSAFDAGFKAAEGEFVITLDGDRQNDPADIPKLVKAVDGYDLVCGQRVNRRDPFHKRWISKLANAVRSRICQDGMDDTGCSLKIYRTECLQQIKMYNGMHRFLPALFQIEGFRCHQVPVNHRPRQEGETKYRFINRSIQPFLDMFAVWWMRNRHLNYKIKR